LRERHYFISSWGKLKKDFSLSLSLFLWYSPTSPLAGSVYLISREEDKELRHRWQEGIAAGKIHSTLKSFKRLKDKVSIFFLFP
jgi:hypothetical protein